jgi:hypothetical protein
LEFVPSLGIGGDPVHLIGYTGGHNPLADRFQYCANFRLKLSVAFPRCQSLTGNTEVCRYLFVRFFVIGNKQGGLSLSVR